jgi:adenosylhomocysteinase
MDGFEVKKLDTVVANADIVITTTGNKDIVLGSL